MTTAARYENECGDSSKGHSILVGRHLRPLHRLLPRHHLPLGGGGGGSGGGRALTGVLIVFLPFFASIFFIGAAGKFGHARIIAN